MRHLASVLELNDRYKARAPTPGSDPRFPLAKLQKNVSLSPCILIVPAVDLERPEMPLSCIKPRGEMCHSSHTS